MPTWPGVNGLKTSFCLVYELWTFNECIPGIYSNPQIYSIILVQLQVRLHRIMIGPGKGKFTALEDLEPAIRENVVYPQRRGNIHIGPADTEPLLQEGILPAAPDRTIRIGIGDIVEIAADDAGIRTLIQLGPHLPGLVPPMFECIPQLDGNGTGGIYNTILYILDDLDIVKLLTAEEHGLKMGRKYPDGVLPGKD